MTEFPWGNGRTVEEYAAAMADRPERKYLWHHDQCGARGPGGECYRSPGHTDTEAYSHNKHVSFDSDHYVDWSVGWKDNYEWLEQADALLTEVRNKIRWYGAFTEVSKKIEDFLARPK